VQLPPNFLPNQPGNRNGFIDKSVYKRVQSMRLLYCSKPGSPRTKNLLNNEFTFRDTVISFVPAHCRFVTFRPPRTRREAVGPRLTARALSLLEERELRQFGCPPCIKIWWRRVPSQKPVSRCANCSLKYDPFSRQEEFGHGKFVCSDQGCDGQWTNSTSKGHAQQPCYKCGTLSFPQKIGPAPPSTTRRTGRTHRCELCPSGECKRSRIPSHPHESTGSTITDLTSSSLSSIMSGLSISSRISVDSGDYPYDSDDSDQ